MAAGEIALAADWAAAEGWNPGLDDPMCFATVDPSGFFVGELNGAAAAMISVVNYDDRFAFLGFYIVRPDLRGRGYGLRIWRASMAHAGTRTIGLDGVVAQQQNYTKSGFSLAYRNIRFGGIPASPATPLRDIVTIRDVPFARIEADDATVFPAPRPAFLRAWIDAPTHCGRALIRDGKLAGWGVIRRCRRGYKIGPLVADHRSDAEPLFSSLIACSDGEEVFLDVTELNPEAVALAKAYGLEPVFETTRMYTGPIRSVAFKRLFGVTTFELG
jgi:hypothetical protein